jgi:hypothetical protein
MRETERRFQVLVEQFAVLERNLSTSQNAEERAELLEGMNAVLVIEELDHLILSIVCGYWLNEG